MRKLILRMEITVDNVAAGEKDGNIEGVDHGDEYSWADIFKTLETVDAMLIGGKSAEEYLGYWDEVLSDAKAPPNEKKFAQIAARTHHYIVSRTAKDTKWPNASVLAGGVDGIAELKRGAGGDMLMWGGPTVAGAAIEAGLIDEMHLLTHPVIAGRGRKLFANVGASHRVRQLSSESFPTGLVLVKYARA